MTTERSERRSESVAIDFVFNRLVPVRHRGRTGYRSKRGLRAIHYRAQRGTKFPFSSLALVQCGLALLLLDILVLGDTGLIFKQLGVSVKMPGFSPDLYMTYAIAPWLAALGPGLISGIGSLVSSFMGGQQSRSNTDKTIAANRHMAEYQYSKDLEMWNRTNEFNSPEMQMQRLRAAGLNPNLVYGGGASGAAGSAQSVMPKYNAPTAQYNYAPVIDVSSAISAYQDMQVKQAQYDNIKAQVNLTEQKYLTEGFLTRMKARRNLAEHTLEFDPDNLFLDAVRSEYQMKRTKADVAKGLGEYQLEFAKGRTKAQSTQIEKMMADMKRTEAATEFTKLQNEWYVTKMLGQFGLGLVKQVGNMFPSAKVGKAATQSFNARTRERAFERTTDALRKFGR